jgi:dipeptidase E
MKQLYLASYFTEIKDLFQKEIDCDLKGKTVTFIPTAANPEKIRFFVESDRKALVKLGMVIDELDISCSDKETITSKIIKNDFIFIAGGNTFYLLQEMIKSEAYETIIKAIESGKPYIGSSAGSIITSKDIQYIDRMDSPKKAPDLKQTKGLSIIDFYPLPHFTNAPFKKIAGKIYEEYKDKLDIQPISNDQMIIVQDNNFRIIKKEYT